MKKLVILSVIILFFGFAKNSFAQKDRRLSNGISISLVAGFPSDVYGFTKGTQIDSENKLGNIWGFKIGNRWYFSPKEKYGLGLMVNWIDFSSASKNWATGDTYPARGVNDYSFLQFGPLGTYAITSNIALDAYYNLRPTVFRCEILSSTPSTGDAYYYQGFGFSNAFGGALRYKLLNLGIEYVFGSIKTKYTEKESYSGNTHPDSQKLMTNNLRILLGVKF